jgi:pimeloyl-ACP methyl ester carboxylesterase
VAKLTNDTSTPSESIVELQGGKFKTRVLTAGRGDPLLYLHGAGGLFWDPFLDGLSAGHRVIAPEHPGFGQSQGLEHVEDLWDLVLYYADLFDALGLGPRVSLVGHSFGGMVAAEVAATHAERIERLVLLCPIGLWRDEHPVPEISAIPPDKLAGLVFADPEGAVARAMPRPDPTDPEALFQASLTIAAVNQFIWPLPDKGLSKRLHRIKAPTLLVWGRQDRLVSPVYGDDFARLIPDARLELIDGAGHLPQLEQLDQLAPLVEAFLDG